MSIREAIQKKPGVAAGVALVAIAACVGLVVRDAVSGPPSASLAAYYSTDDGQSQFVGAMDRDLPPFDHGGKPASRVWMFTCDGGKSKFAGYLERYTPEGKKRLEDAVAAYRSGKSKAPPEANPNDVEVKKPGASERWVRQSDVRAASVVTSVKCPDGKFAQAVMP